MAISREEEIDTVKQDTNEVAHTTRLHFVPLLCSGMGKTGCPFHDFCDGRRILPYDTWLPGLYKEQYSIP